MTPSGQYWLVVGTHKNWHVSFQNRNIWGLKDFRELKALWNLMREGDNILLYVSKPVSGVVGCGVITSKFRQTQPLWDEEIRRSTVIWPLRFEYDLEYCVSPELWKTRAYRENDLQLITRMVFQCVPASLADRVRQHFDLPPLVSSRNPADLSLVETPGLVPNHQTTKQQLVEIGKIQGYIAEEEYPIDSNRLDVVWRRVERSVPTYAFEVQFAGDIYHALVKLKRAYELWNSHLFLTGTVQARSKFEELTASSFHEIASRVRFLEAGTVNELLLRKLSYKQLERSLGILT